MPAFAAAILLTSFGSSLFAQQPAEEQAPGAKFELAQLRGKVVFLGEELAEGKGVETVPEARQRYLAVKTTDGKFIPLVEDVRGRAFRADERLRGRELVLLVRRYESHPLAQVIRTFEPKEDGLHELDYWCDICAIAMYEFKECDCCQGPIRLRSRETEQRDLPAVLRE